MEKIAKLKEDDSNNSNLNATIVIHDLISFQASQLAMYNNDPEEMNLALHKIFDAQQEAKNQLLASFKGNKEEMDAHLKAEWLIRWNQWNIDMNKLSATLQPIKFFNDDVGNALFVQLRALNIEKPKFFDDEHG